MISFIKCDQFGRIIERVLTNNPDYGEYGYIAVEDVPSTATHYLNGVFSIMPASPSKFHEWDEQAYSWEITSVGVNLAKQEAKNQINSARDAARNGGFSAFDKVFDSDEASRTNILFASQAANMLPDDFTINWTCADNSQITLSKTQLLQLPVFLVSAGNVIHQRALELKAQIDAANTLEEINAVVW